jgi:hypothetical protein
MVASFAEYAPHSRKFTPEESIDHVLKVAHDATIEKYGGAAVSHKGDDQWL